MLSKKSQSRLIFIILISTILISLVFAFTFNDGIDYEKDDKLVIFENLGKVELKSHEDVDVPIHIDVPVNIYPNGIKPDVVVMYYDFYDWKDLYVNGLGEVKFIDKINDKVIIKDYKFVYAVYEDIIIPENKTIPEYTITQIKEWVELIDKNIPKEKITIGLMVDVQRGEWIDAVWTIAGKEVSRHAEWESLGFGHDYTDICADDFKGATFNGSSILLLCGDALDDKFIVIDHTDLTSHYTINLPSIASEHRGMATGLNSSGQISIWYVEGDTTDQAYEVDGSGRAVKDWNLGAGECGNEPYGITYLDGFLYIVDYVDKDVCKYTLDGVFDSIQFNIADVFLQYPVAIGNNGTDFFISDFLTDEMQPYKLDGTKMQELTLSALSGRSMGFATNLSVTPAGETSAYFIVDEDYGIRVYEGSVAVSSDSEIPNVIINVPTNTTYTSIQTEINYTATDDGTLDVCWYSNNSGTINSSTQTCGTNWSSLTYGQGSTTIRVYANDSLNKLNYTDLTFFVDSIYPDIRIDIPAQNLTNSTNFDYNINYTYLETNPDSCWWSDDWGSTNNSLTCGENLTDIGGWVEGLNQVIISINDTLNNVNSTSIAFTIDATAPTFDNLANQSLYDNSSLSFDIDATDTEVGVECFAVNDTTNFEINCAGVLTNKTELTIQRYNIEITVNDTLNNALTTAMWVEVNSSDLTNPDISNLNWRTTGGFTGTNLVFLQTLDYVNVTASDNNNLNVYLDVYDPDLVQVINNQSMTNYNGNDYSYGTDFQLNKVGTWSFNTTAVDQYGNENTTSTSISVSAQAQGLKDGWYGYSSEGIISSADVITLSAYGYDLFELEDSSSTLNASWTSIKTSINDSGNSNIKIGLNILLDFDYNSSTEKLAVMTNISEIISDLILVPYTDTINYISLELVNPGNYNASQKTLVINDIAENISASITNEYVIYSRNYNTGLDNSYIQSTTLLYLTSANNKSFITDQNNLFKTETSLNRIYVSISDDVKQKAKEFHENIVDSLRSTVSSTSLADQNTSALTNGDILVFNNQSTIQNISVSILELTTVNGTDAWDYINNYVIAMNNNLTFVVEVAGHSAVNVIFENLDHIQMDSLTSSNLYKGGSSSSISSNHTDNVRDGNFGLYGAIDLLIEINDPFYTQANFITYYGWLNASFIDSPSGWQNYDVVILADTNDAELDALNYSATDFYGYISVADYNDSYSDSWLINKSGEVDTWLSLNESLNIFVDGLDSGIGGDNFTIYMKSLIDYIQVDKNRSAILNTYTAYQEFATWGNGGVMKESCVNRWNGNDAINPDNYTAENWSLELERSIWFDSHNVNVYCQAFDYRDTGEGTNLITNWTDMQNIYFASKVLGYDYFYLSQPDFNYAHEEWVYDVGADLDNSYHQSTTDSNVYYRTYENGIVYYNSTSEAGWIDDGLVINNKTACFYLYDSHETNTFFSLDVNEGAGGVGNGEYIIDDGWGVGTWSWECADITEETPINGRYLIHMWAGAGTIIIGQGFNLGYSDATGTGRHSWWDNDGGTNSYSAYQMDRNWMVNIKVNQTKKASVDTTTKITQSESYNGTTKFLNLSSDYSFPIEVWSYPASFNSTNIVTFYFKNSTGGLDGLNVLNTTTCDSDDPSFALTTIETKTHKACYTQNATATIFRVATPDLSTKEYQFDFDTIAPYFTDISNQTAYNNESFSYDINATDETSFDSFKIDDTTNFTINISTGIITNITGLTVNYYMINITINDSSNNLNSTLWSLNVSESADTINPNLTINIPSNTTYTTTTINFNITAIDNTGIDSCWLTLNSGVKNYSMNNLSTNDYNYTNISMNQGSFTVSFYCNDTSNNINNSESVTFIVDSLPPVITITNPVSGEDEVADPINLIFNTDDLTTCEYSLDSGINTSISSANSKNYSKSFSLANGNHRFDIYCSNTAYLNSTSSVEFYVSRLISGGTTSSGSTTSTGINLNNLTVKYGEWKKGKLNSIYAYTYDDDDLIDVDISFKIIEDIDYTKNIVREGVGKYRANFLIEDDVQEVSINVEAVDKTKLLDKLVKIELEEQDFTDKVDEFIKEKVSRIDKLLENKNLLIVIFGSIATLITLSVIFFVFRKK